MRRSSLCLLIVPLLCLGAAACTDEESETPDAGPPLQDFYLELRETVLALPIDNGDWADDFGDAAYYGLAYPLRMGLTEGREELVTLATQVKDRNIQLVNETRTRLLGSMDILEEVVMAVLGLIEYMSITGDDAAIADLDGLMDLLNSMVAALGNYLDLDMESYALETYGPTSVTAMIALVNLRYGELLSNDRTADRIETGIAIIEGIDAHAFPAEQTEFYRFHPTTDALFLYPNISMVMANALAHKLTGEARFKARAIEIHRAIQPLRDLVKRCYRSPYSAQTMGAQTDDYATLSSQNYTLLALAMLFEITGDPTYRDEITEIMTFIRDVLHQEGRLLHHWMDGRLAIPSDPEYFCSGCNLQFLYAHEYVARHLYGHEPSQSP